MVNEKLSSLIEVAETIADNKYVLGDRLVEVGISGPTIEATLSSISMAQQELGHSRLIYKWALDLKGVNDNSIEIKEQTGKAFRSNVEISNWLELIAGLHATNIAVDLVIREIANTENPNIKPPFSKMLNEQKDNLVYSNGWCAKLLNDKGSIPKRFKEALSKIGNETREWLRNVEKNPQLISEKIISQNSNLVEKFDRNLKDILVDGVVTNAV